MNKFWLLLSMLFVTSLQAQTASDTLEILNLLEKESRTWRSGDVAGHAECWQERPYNKIWVNRGGGELLDIPASMIIHPSNDMIGQGGQAYLSNIQMNIFGDRAWVNHDEVSVNVEGKEAYTHELRFLERVDGAWKLVGQSLYPYELTEKNTDTTSYVNIVDIATKQVETVHIANRYLESPYWHQDDYLLMNLYGHIEKIDLASGEVSKAPGAIIKKENEWSKELSNDIYSSRSESSQIWQKSQGESKLEQLTFDQYSNWFRHISPDNKWLVFLSYLENQSEPHPFGKKVILRLMNLETKEITDLTSVFYGGQGTINVPSWSPDSKRVAFVSYSIGN